LKESDKMGAVFEYQRQVEWGECDPHGFIFFPNYFRWMAEGYHRMMRHLGIAVTPHIDAETMRGTPALSSESRYFAPARLEETVSHRMTVSEIRSRSFSITHAFLRGDMLLMESRDTKGWARISTKPPVTIALETMPADILDRLSGVLRAEAAP
jgi:4-hydroxybenzoyl-CoA thioesterase